VLNHMDAMLLSNPHPFPKELCCNDKKPMAVMLSAAKHLAFSVTYEEEILRLLPQDDIPTQSQKGEG
jgi:hypothetical protein